MIENKHVLRYRFAVLYFILINMTFQYIHIFYLTKSTNINIYFYVNIQCKSHEKRSKIWNNMFALENHQFYIPHLKITLISFYILIEHNNFLCSSKGPFQQTECWRLRFDYVNTTNTAQLLGTGHMKVDIMNLSMDIWNWSAKTKKIQMMLQKLVWKFHINNAK